jgi:hypothetical protein
MERTGFRGVCSGSLQRFPVGMTLSGCARGAGGAEDGRAASGVARERHRRRLGPGCLRQCCQEAQACGAAAKGWNRLHD